MNASPFLSLWNSELQCPWDKHPQAEKNAEQMAGRDRRVGRDWSGVRFDPGGDGSGLRWRRPFLVTERYMRGRV